MSEKKNVIEDWHHVSMTVSRVMPMAIARNDQQKIKAIVALKLDIVDAIELRRILDTQIEAYQSGKGPITASLEGEFA